MEQFDYLIQNGTIMTMQSREQVLKGACLGITGDRISYVGHSNDLPMPVAKRVVDAKGGLVLPGLVNGHTHAAMTLFRGLADDLPLMEWLTNYIFPVEKRMDTAFVKTGALLACAEMILSGTTTFCDMYLFEEEIAEAAKEAGMRCLVGEVLYDFPSPNYGAIEKGFDAARGEIAGWLNSDDIYYDSRVFEKVVRGMQTLPERMRCKQTEWRNRQLSIIIRSNDFKLWSSLRRRT